jgi:hypothetical protein
MAWSISYWYFYHQVHEFHQCLFERKRPLGPGYCADLPVYTHGWVRGVNNLADTCVVFKEFIKVHVIVQPRFAAQRILFTISLQTQVTFHISLLFVICLVNRLHIRLTAFLFYQDIAHGRKVWPQLFRKAL